jgi:hypothetical protein
MRHSDTWPYAASEKQSSFRLSEHWTFYICLHSSKLGQYCSCQVNSAPQPNSLKILRHIPPSPVSEINLTKKLICPSGGPENYFPLASTHAARDNQSALGWVGPSPPDLPRTVTCHTGKSRRERRGEGSLLPWPATRGRTERLTNERGRERSLFSHSCPTPATNPRFPAGCPYHFTLALPSQFFFNHSTPGVLWKHESGQKETVWPMPSLWRLDRSLQNVEKENQVQDEGDAT